MLFPTEKKTIEPDQLRLILRVNQRNCPFVKHIDPYTVKYMGKGLMHTDVATIQTQKPASKDDIIFYFEVKIIEVGARGDICIGLAEGNFPSNKHPGYTKNSYGYKSDGKTFYNKLASMQTFPKYNSEDVIGCGLNYLKKEIFFTHNGNFLGAPFKRIEIGELYPTIGLHSPNESIKFNFDIKFKIADYREKELQSTREEILSLDINSFSIHQIVHSYLYHQGYYQTLDCFEKIAALSRDNTVILKKSKEMEEEPKNHALNGKKSIEIEEEIKENCQEVEFSKDCEEELGNHKEEGTLEERTKQKDRDWVRDWVNKGELDHVFEFLKEKYPSLLEEKSIVLAIYAQQFLEFIRQGDIGKGIELAQRVFPNNEEEILDFIDRNGNLAQLKLEEILGIICYEKPENCNIGFLLEINQREILAEKLNAAIFGKLEFNRKSILELLLGHYMLINEKNSELNCYLGNLFDYS